MSQRGMNPFIKALVNFAKSLRPAALRDPIHKGKLIGRDHLGNAYYETQTLHRTARFFIPKDMNDWDKELPSEWHAWLRKRRDNPPTQEESQRNLDRIERFKPKEETSQTTESEVTKSKFSKFPIYKEYEETPGAKYK